MSLMLLSLFLVSWLLLQMTEAAAAAAEAAAAAQGGVGTSVLQVGLCAREDELARNELLLRKRRRSRAAAASLKEAIDARYQPY